MPKPIYQIAAVAENGVIGLNRKLPWRIPEEWDYFLNITSGGVMIMGRICAEEFGEGMPDRDMIAVTHQRDFSLPGFQVAHSLEEALELAEASKHTGAIWICGGEKIYRDSFDESDRLYISLVHREFEGDTYFPEEWPDIFPKEISREDKRDADIPYSICVYSK